MRIAGKDYVIPELTFEHAELMENESGLSLYEVVFGKQTMTACRVFLQAVTGKDADEVKVILNDHFKIGGYKALSEIVDAFVEAVKDSDFFCALLGLPTKAERAIAEHEAKTETDEKQSEI